MTADIVTPDFGGVEEPAWPEMIDDALDIELARELWTQAVAEMRHAGTLSPVNGLALKRYVLAAVVYDRAARDVFERGATISRSGKQPPAWNLNWSVLKDANAMMESAEDKLGLSPRRRGAVTAAKKRAAKVTAADAFLTKKA